jgi:hypothetical protein
MAGKASLLGENALAGSDTAGHYPYLANCGCGNQYQGKKDQQACFHRL